ncbi:MAG TPA: glycosyltransferase family 4 protein [Paracoccaceae bacterium]|nr:glycosyltransferase family 4 protein [Paracoccaceae bacterium]
MGVSRPSRVCRTSSPSGRTPCPADLLIAGSGDCEPELRRLAAGRPNIRFLGRKAMPELRRLYRDAIALIAPSRCYEVFPMVVLEAFREGTPIVARDLGPYPEIVRQSGGGLLFGTPTELAQCLQRLAAEPGLAAALGLNAALAFARHWREDAALGVYFALIRDCAARRGLEHPALWPRTASGRETIAALVVTRAAQAPWPALGETGEGGRHRHK